MNEHYIYIRFEGYLRQWIINRYGYIIHFPRGSYEHHLMKQFLTDREPPISDCLLYDNKMLKVVVPRLEGKPWKKYHHIGRRGVACLVDSIEDLFCIDLWNGCKHCMYEGNVLNTIYDWCKNHGISLDYVDTVYKKFYRMRLCHTNKGIKTLKTNNKNKNVKKN